MGKLTTTDRASAIIPTNFAEVSHIAEVLSKSGIVPQAYSRKPEAAAAAILFGLEVGLPPMAALRTIAVINGTPALYADGQLAVVRRSGLLEDFAEKIEGEGDARVAVCWAKRVGQKSEILHRYSVEDAKVAGLWGKAGPWKNHPRRMLQMRARSFVLRDGFADVIQGISAEEVQDTPEAQYRGPGRAKDVTPDPETPARAEPETVRIVAPTGEEEIVPAIEWRDAVRGYLATITDGETYRGFKDANASLGPDFLDLCKERAAAIKAERGGLLRKVLAQLGEVEDEEAFERILAASASFRASLENGAKREMEDAISAARGRINELEQMGDA